MLMVLLGGAALMMSIVATLPTAPLALAVLAIGMGLLGMGNGSVFQLVPQRFPDRVGIMTGIVGAAGGLGGFFLPSILGLVKQKTQSFGIGFALLATCMFAGVVALVYLRSLWQRTWNIDAAQRAGLLAGGGKEAEDVYATST